MLRSYQQVRAAAPAARQIASDEDRAVLTGGGIAYRAPWHWHDCLMILLPNQGALGFKDEQHRTGTWLSEERFVVVPKLAAHETEAARGSHVALYLTEAMLSRIEATLGSLERLRRTKSPTIFSLTPEIRALQNLCAAGDPADPAVRAAREHLSSALLVNLLAQIERTDPLPNANASEHGSILAAELRAYIEAHAAEEVPLDVIAETFGLSRRHATRLFRQWSGVSIAEYRERWRVNAARQLLTDTTLPVGEIAFRVGYEFGSALARAMRRHLGQSPSDVRRN